MPGVSQPLHRALGLTDDEAVRIEEILGRPANGLELAMYSVMWSEHCSYKSSRIHLGRLPTEAPWVLFGPGENAGAVDVGDGIAAAIRIESHNHPCPLYTPDAADDTPTVGRRGRCSIKQNTHHRDTAAAHPAPHS